jgi:hypothetical protein
VRLSHPNLTAHPPPWRGNPKTRPYGSWRSV